jgi:hypothetical protein
MLEETYFVTILEKKFHNNNISIKDPNFKSKELTYSQFHSLTQTESISYLPQVLKLCTF